MKSKSIIAVLILAVLGVCTIWSMIPEIKVEPKQVSSEESFERTEAEFKPLPCNEYVIEAEIRRKVIVSMLDMWATGGNRPIPITVTVDSSTYNKFEVGEVYDGEYFKSLTGANYIMPSTTVLIKSKRCK